MKIAIGQMKSFLGDFKESGKKLKALVNQAKKMEADLLVLPEGGIFGYPPTDFIKQPRFLKMQMQVLHRIQKTLPSDLKLLTGAFMNTKQGLKNGACLLEKGAAVKMFFKEFLPDQDVFSESRHFMRGNTAENFFRLKSKRIQILVCEDMWALPDFEKPDLIICLNSSPYTNEKHKKRIQYLKKLAQKHKSPAVYVNRVGGQGELIFDGGSFCLNKEGETSLQCDFFKEDLQIAKFNKGKSKNLKLPAHWQAQEKALILGLKDFFSQTGFSKAHLGISGGIDSALVCYLAVKALGQENVTGWFLPGPYTSPQSRKIAKDLHKAIGFHWWELSMTPVYKKFLEELFPVKKPLSITDQNLQARLRMISLMTHANEDHSLLLATGNKSELACGYATLYGDLAGALMPIGDLFKTEVYGLCRFINTKQQVFSQELLSRPPTAELKPQQRDREDLPDYKILDPILNRLINHQPPRSQMEKQIERKLRRSEFKRHQAPLVLKISETAFGMGWKFPIAHRFPSS